MGNGGGGGWEVNTAKLEKQTRTERALSKEREKVQPV